MRRRWRSDPGEVTGWPGLWRDAAGLHPEEEEKGFRAVQYTDDEGRVRGVVVYSIKEADGKAALRIQSLLAASTDAYAALWRFALTHDLIGTVTANLRSLDEPVRWMLEDQRALTSTEHDHHWVRILDVAAALGARRYRAAGSVVLEVEDPLAITGGRFLLTVDGEGSGSVQQLSADAAPDAAVVQVGISELSSLLHGEARWGTLAAGGSRHGRRHGDGVARRRVRTGSPPVAAEHRVLTASRSCPTAAGRAASQPELPRRTISWIQIGAKGEVQFGGVG